MENPLFLLVLIGLLTAFLALFISVIFERFLNPKYEETFSLTLKFALLGGLFGMIIFFVVWLVKKQVDNTWEAPGTIAIIPIYTMLVGQLLGVYLISRKKKEIN